MYSSGTIKNKTVTCILYAQCIQISKKNKPYDKFNFNEQKYMCV